MTVPTVLFVCVHNAGRSQMAAALLARAGGEAVAVRSAGTTPAARVYPAVVDAMAELGIDLAAARPRVLDDADARTADEVITMGCGDACPVYPGTRHLDWPVEDPAGRPFADVRRIRDAIAERVEGLLRELGS